MRKRSDPIATELFSEVALACFLIPPPTQASKDAVSFNKKLHCTYIIREGIRLAPILLTHSHTSFYTLHTSREGIRAPNLPIEKFHPKMTHDHATLVPR